MALRQVKLLRIETKAALDVAEAAGQIQHNACVIADNTGFIYYWNGAAWVAVNDPSASELVPSNAGLGTMANKLEGVAVHIGDSNTVARPGYRNAYEAEWFREGGVFENWTSYNLGQNGSTLAEWATTEISNTTNPTYSDLPPVDYQPAQNPGAGRLARALNADPDLIFLSLGTNDLNNPGSRASIGTEANLRTNLGILVNFLLANTHASILLRMPAPFAHEDFSGITQWVNADEAAEASRRLRVVYREWIGRSDRVEVYDSHLALFGDRCDNKATDCQDRWLGAGNPLIVDSLHPTDLGFRRMVQQMGQQIVRSHLRNPRFNPVPVDLTRYATWAVTLHCRNAAASSGTSYTADWDLSQEAAIANQTRANLASVSPASMIGAAAVLKPQLELAHSLGVFSGWQELINIPTKSQLYAYSHTTGVTTQLTNLVINQYVVSGGIPYAQMTLSAADVTGLGGGRVTIYTTDARNLPSREPDIIPITMTQLQVIVATPYVPFTITKGRASRLASFQTPVITAYLSNQPDTGFISGGDNFAAPGKPIGTFSFTAQGTIADFIFDPTNYPAGITIANGTHWITLKLTTGSMNDLGGQAQLYLSER